MTRPVKHVTIRQEVRTERTEFPRETLKQMGLSFVWRKSGKQFCKIAPTHPAMTQTFSEAKPTRRDRCLYPSAVSAPRQGRVGRLTNRITPCVLENLRNAIRAGIKGKTGHFRKPYKSLQQGHVSDTLNKSVPLQGGNSLAIYSPAYTYLLQPFMTVSSGRRQARKTCASRNVGIDTPVPAIAPCRYRTIGPASISRSCLLPCRNIPQSGQSHGGECPSNATPKNNKQDGLGIHYKHDSSQAKCVPSTELYFRGPFATGCDGSHNRNLPLVVCTGLAELGDQGEAIHQNVQREEGSGWGESWVHISLKAERNSGGY
uniref:Uncharacterized protein n=1 Tax=Timema monikensis TaxID=170555 RepID=A0A7R9HTI9_9NEOP|nr:unnamed protein product [Timema monikensis]